MRQHGTRRGEQRLLWLLEPNREAALYVVDRKEDYEDLANGHPKRWAESAVSTRLPAAPDWNAIALQVGTRIDGIHVTDSALHSSQALWGWDVEIDPLARVGLYWGADTSRRSRGPLGAFAPLALGDPLGSTVLHGTAEVTH